MNDRFELADAVQAILGRSRLIDAKHMKDV